MNFMINSPSYYTQHFGVIDDIYRMCREISKNIDISEYTDSLDTIGIVPIIAPNEIREQGNYQDYKKVGLKSRMAIISLNSDYTSFCDAGLNQKKQIIVENILRSLLVVKERLKGNFDYERMERDILSIAQTFLETDSPC